MASVFKQRYTATDKNGEKVTRQSRFYYIDYKAADGTRKRVKGFRDKAATAQLAAQLEREAELGRAGMIDKYVEHRKRPLKDHLEDFKQALMDKGNTSKHALMTYRQAKTVVEGCRWAFVTDVSASSVENFLANKRRAGLGKNTSNHYLQSVKQFFSWLKSDGRMAENPLEHLRRLNAKTDVRHERRALSLEELNTLVEAAENGPVHHGLSGHARAMLYLLAASTGLRAEELATLRWNALDLSGDSPTVTIWAGYSKHRRKDILPLRQEVAGVLDRWRVERAGGPDQRLFSTLKHMRWADMLKRDLAVANISYADSVGRVVDFHALRHTFITHVVKSGASPKVAQALARHSKITLTMDVYTHMGLHDQRKALEDLPPLPCLDGCRSRREAAVRLKTGTDDRPLADTGRAYKKLTKRSDFGGPPESLSGIATGTSDGNVSDIRYGGKSLLRRGLGAKRQALSAFDTDKALIEAEGTRTLNLRIDSLGRAFVSPCGKTINNCRITAYEIRRRSAEGQTKARRTCLARTLARA